MKILVASSFCYCFIHWCRRMFYLLMFYLLMYVHIRVHISLAPLFLHVHTDISTKWLSPKAHVREWSAKRTVNGSVFTHCWSWWRGTSNQVDLGDPKPLSWGKFKFQAWCGIQGQETYLKGRNIIQQRPRVPGGFTRAFLGPLHGYILTLFSINS